MPRRAFVTGSAGFIGFHLCRHLLAAGWEVTGYDALTDYYDVGLKRRRHATLLQSPAFAATEARLEDMEGLRNAAGTPDVIVHLAAQAGVRHSLTAPRDYVSANLEGTFNVLELAREVRPDHLLLASTSSAYGANTDMPFAETDRAVTPMSLYAATKLATEHMAHAYAHLHRLPTTMFRFFTVYGPWGRPDMALFKFTKAILEGAPIDLYNHGRMERDFTYVDDLVRGIALLIDAVPPQADAEQAPVDGDSLSPVAPFRVVNIGNSEKVALEDFVAAIEKATGRTAERRLLPMQPGDVPATWADAGLLQRLTGYRPETKLVEGVQRFVAWYREFYQV